MSEIEKALKILKSDGVVGMPTETVYGLAASINSKQGLLKIFKVKERPFFDPLIVHVSSIKQAEALTTDWSPLCQKLADNFWPGALTLILEKSSLVDDVITSGLSTVGIRFPSHPIAKELIEKLGNPVAAPSANKFKKISPTTKEHVEAEFSEVLVLDGGESIVGIESTIVQVKESEVVILRPGMISMEQLKNALGTDIKISYQESSIAPGHLKEHYRPNKPLILNISENGTPHTIEHSYDQVSTWELPQDSTHAARVLYASLRELDSKSNEAIEVLVPIEVLNLDQFRGILNRLVKAAHLKNTLIKSEY